ncbi:S-adenosyl-L-methionine-dependent methyltransferase [Microdochium bolleyi]|uniref:S-adenosyl-L-methionine-dependent methyltransferase n=1 Tax=Microdochium bolleyi TaxID=196109 RepID=A0A136JGM0_9PEZI|nr:S-adenosyl-L-methionine-dependent methyltransferase [Microdochium bolleyi]
MGPKHAGGAKRAHQGRGKPEGERNFKKARKRERDMQNGSHEEVLRFDVEALLNATAESAEQPPLPVKESQIDVEVLEVSSTGDGLAVHKGSNSKHIYIVPFTVPGDVVKVKVWRQVNDEMTEADFISVVEPSPLRDDGRIKCGYFSKCSGCQFQMLDYEEQLKHKKRIVERAFKNFSQLPPELVPTIGDTIGSPLQYGYRTKLTPHFEGPAGSYKKHVQRPALEHRPDIGFMLKGTRKTMDIEDCPIGTDAVRRGMKSERERMEREFGKYTRGATILLRESTQRTCVTDNKGNSTEYIDDFIFHNPAGSFFQNNNSILPKFTDYIRQHILPPSTAADEPSPKIKNLIDAYSGSGLFTITLSSLFSGHATGIDIAEGSIACARRNAAANGRPESQTNFIAADAAELFKSVVGNDQYSADETVVVLDPPRKGCDASFLSQLMRYGPRRIVYVSCNVHTQARDIGCLVRGSTSTMETGDSDGKSAAGGSRYEMESLRGFDFFPQSAHVEGVAVLNRVDSDAAAAPAAPPS